MDARSINVAGSYFTLCWYDLVEDLHLDSLSNEQAIRVNGPTVIGSD